MPMMAIPVAGPDAGTLARPMSELAAALHAETRLLDELRQNLLRQREAVAGDDPAAVEGTVAAIGRTLFTLEEARRRRSALTRHLSGDATDQLAELERHLGGPLAAPVAEARRAVRAAAEAVQREVRINQVVLRRVLEAGDAFLQQLFSAGMEQAPAYAADARVAAPAVPAGRVLDRQA